MEAPKSFSSAAEIEEFAAKLTAARHRKVLTMRVTRESLDDWLLKGLDGLKGHFLNRSIQETPMSQSNLDGLKRIVRLLEECASFEKDATTDDTDEMLVFASVALVEILSHRIRTPLGGLSEGRRSDIKRVLLDLKIAQARLKDKENVKPA